MENHNITFVKRTGRNTNSTGLLILVIIMFLALVPAAIIKGQYNPFTNITDDSYPQYNPAIYENFVVYEEKLPGEGMNIILYNITTGEKLKLNSGQDGMALRPDIYGDRVVWQDSRSGEFKIYTYLISRPDLGDFLMFDIYGAQTSPALYENTLVWIDHRGDEFSSNVFMYDISTAEATQITTDDDLQQYSPDIYGPNIVYYDGRNGNYDIYLYNITTKEEIRLTEDNADQSNPSIFKNRVVWEDERNGNKDLYMKYIISWSGQPSSTYLKCDWPIFTRIGFREMSPYSDINPAVYEDYIVFQSYRNGSWNIYLYSFINDIFGSTSALITEAKDQINPAIWDNRIVWQDERDWNGTSAYKADIWLWERPPGADLGVMITDYPDTVVTGSTMLYTIVVKNFGNQEATDVVFTQTLPDEVEFVHASSSGDHTFNMDNNTLTCNIASLHTGETDSINVLVKTLVNATIVTSCQISATEEDPVPENNSISVKTAVRWIFPDIIDTGGMPKIITDNQGYVHILYTDFYGAGQGRLRYAANTTGKWVIDYELASPTDIKYKSIDIDSENHIHIVYATGEFRDKTIMYINNVSGEWSAPATIKEHTRDCVSLTLHLDSEDKMHIAYMKSSSRWDSLMYINNTTGAWETELISERSYSMISFELDNNDHAHFVYISANETLDPITFKPTYITNSPAGTWSAPEYIEENYYGEGYGEKFIFDLDVANNGVPHVIYTGAADYPEDNTQVLKYANREDGAWQNEIIDNRDFSLVFMAITTDADNDPHMVYSNYLDYPLMKLIYSNRKDDSWENQELEPGDNPIFDVDICSDHWGNIHVACEDAVHELIFINYYFIEDSASYPKVGTIPDHITFDPQLVGTESESQRIIVLNSGSMLDIYDIIISDTDAPNFKISGSNCNFLNTGATCIVDVIFNPQSEGYKYARLKIISNDPNQPDFWVPLEGIGELATHISSVDENPILIYPNPSKDIITIQFNSIIPEDEYLMKIISLNGEVIKEKMIRITPHQYSFQININDMADGLYLITLSGKGLYFQFRFMKTG